MRKVFFATLIEAPGAAALARVFETGGTIAGTTPGGNCGAALAPGGQPQLGSRAGRHHEDDGQGKEDRRGGESSYKPRLSAPQGGSLGRGRQFRDEFDARA